MNVQRKIIGSAVIAAVATITAVTALPELDLVQYVMPIMKVGIAGVILLTGISVYLEGELNDNEKSLLMNGFLIAILVPSLFAAGAFVHESETSWTGGEVHWHADFEIIVENGDEMEEINLVDPGQFCEETGHESSYMCEINDRTGSTEYHEHNDDRIHLEGTFKEREGATLSAFFEQFYGELSNNRLVVPTNEGERVFENNEDRTVKILVQKGAGPERGWCVVGTGIDEEEICESHGVLADSPDKYIVSPHTQGPNLDKMFIVYDSLSLEEALENVREDDQYRGNDLTKEGSGYGS